MILLRNCGSVICFLQLLYLTSGQTYQDIKRLHDDLLNTRRYNKNVKPLASSDNDVIVDVSLYLLSIYRITEKSQTVTGDVYWDISWQDEMLSWNESEYNGTDHIYVPTDNIWMPDIVVSNGVGHSKFLENHFRTDHVSILSDGTVGWWPTGDVTIQCEIILTKFPFDSQICYYEIEQWYMDQSDMVLITSTTGPSLEYYRLNEEWDISDTNYETDMYRDSFGNYSAVRFIITLERRPSFYIITMLLPVFVLSFLNSFCFLLPPESGEKIGVSISLFLTFILLLTIVTAEMPSSSRNVFIFEIIIGIHLFNSGLNLTLSIFIVKAYNTPYVKSVFNQIDRIKCKWPNIRCRKKKGHISNMDAPTSEMVNNIVNLKIDNYVSDGKNIAKRIDLFLFKTTIVINTMLAVGFLLAVLN